MTYNSSKAYCRYICILAAVFGVSFIVDFISHAIGHPLGHLFIIGVDFPPDAVSTWALTALSSALLMTGLANYFIMVYIFCKKYFTTTSLGFRIAVAFLVPLGLVVGILLLIPNVVIFLVKWLFIKH